ncbi:MAG: helix-turn-helix domain-containing protein [Phycisphaerales bacterium]|nr:helix-turn-helix domain-containing protein [Phycisphaerales bacterium]
MPAPNPSVVLTVGEIARRLGVPVHRVEYVIRTRDIHPSVLAGNLRVFTEADLDHIGTELRRTSPGGRAGVPSNPTPEHNSPQPHRLLIGGQEAAAMLSISPRSLWSRMKAGDIPHTRIGSRVLYSVESLTRWVEDRSKGGAL